MTREWMLRTCDSDLSGYGDFQWPREGPVEAPDWSPEPVCGYGLHGLLRGEGDGRMLDWSEDAVWLVVEIDANEIVDLAGKIKVPRGVVIYAGDRAPAIAMMQKKYPDAVVVGGTVTAGDRGSANAGDWGNATAGECGTATAGHRGTATVGYRGTATVGYRGMATAGDLGTATAGDHGTAIAGDCGTAIAWIWGAATAGDWGTATAGHRGTATVGYRGTATVGYRGMATAGDCGKATAGTGGVIRIRYGDAPHEIAIGHIGENGLLPHVAYRVDDKGRFIACTEG